MISGHRVPSQANRRAFDRAVKKVAAAGHGLFDSLDVKGANWG